MATYMFEIKETAAMTKRFVAGNIKKPLISLLPYWIVLGLIEAGIGSKNEAIPVITGILFAYLGALLATNFHRGYMQNHEVQSINPLKPRKEDWRYIGAFMVIYISIFAIGGLIGFISHSAFGQVGTGFTILVLLPVAVFIVLRLSFIFPDRAINGHLKFKEAYNLSRGLVLKIIATPIVAGWKWLIVMLIWFFAANSLALLVAPDILTIPAEEPGMPPTPAPFPMPDITSTRFHMASFILSFPANFGIGYYMAALGVTALSNYYLWAKNNQAR